MHLFSRLFVLLFSMTFFYVFFRCLLGSILSSQADPPILKNLDFVTRELDFRKIKVWDLKMLFRMFWGSLGLILGALGGLLRALFALLGGFRWHPEFPKLPLESL